MTCRRLCFTALLVSSLVGATAVGAQENVDVSKLPVDVSRIQRQLRQAEVREERNGLNLQYFVDVYGTAPRIELFTKKDNLLNGPVPYGGPTHRDVLQAITPQEYRPAVADFSALFRWFADKAKDRK